MKRQIAKMETSMLKADVLAYRGKLVCYQLDELHNGMWYYRVELDGEMIGDLRAMGANEAIEEVIRGAKRSVEKLSKATPINDEEKRMIAKWIEMSKKTINASIDTQTI